jgi:hypothetical protein
VNRRVLVIVLVVYLIMSFVPQIGLMALMGKNSKPKR